MTTYTLNIGGLSFDLPDLPFGKSRIVWDILGRIGNKFTGANGVSPTEQDYLDLRTLICTVTGKTFKEIDDLIITPKEVFDSMIVIAQAAHMVPKDDADKVPEGEG